MALNISTFKTDCDTVSDLLEAELDTAAHHDTMIADILADDDAVNEAYRLQQLLVAILADLGVGPKAYPVEDIRFA